MNQEPGKKPTPKELSQSSGAARRRRKNRKKKYPASGAAPGNTPTRTGGNPSQPKERNLNVSPSASSRRPTMEQINKALEAMTPSIVALLEIHPGLEPLIPGKNPVTRSARPQVVFLLQDSFFFEVLTVLWFDDREMQNKWRDVARWFSLDMPAVLTHDRLRELQKQPLPHPFDSLNENARKSEYAEVYTFLKGLADFSPSYARMIGEKVSGQTPEPLLPRLAAEPLLASHIEKKKVHDPVFAAQWESCAGFSAQDMGWKLPSKTQEKQENAPSKQDTPPPSTPPAPEKAATAAPEDNPFAASLGIMPNQEPTIKESSHNTPKNAEKSPDMTFPAPAQTSHTTPEPQQEEPQAVFEPSEKDSFEAVPSPEGFDAVIPTQPEVNAMSVPSDMPNMPESMTFHDLFRQVSLYVRDLTRYNALFSLYVPHKFRPLRPENPSKLFASIMSVFQSLEDPTKVTSIECRVSGTRMEGKVVLSYQLRDGDPLHRAFSWSNAEPNLRRGGIKGTIENWWDTLQEKASQKLQDSSRG